MLGLLTRLMQYSLVIRDDFNPAKNSTGMLELRANALSSLWLIILSVVKTTSSRNSREQALFPNNSILLAIWSSSEKLDQISERNSSTISERRGIFSEKINAATFQRNISFT